MKRTITAAIVSAGLVLSGCSRKTSIRFGTAPEGGVYYSFGAELARLVTEQDPDYQISVRSTAGSAANLRLLSEGYIKAGIAQSDLINEMYYDADSADTDNAKTYSAIASLYMEAVQIVVRSDSDIHTLFDLQGKKVSIGQEESGTERNAKELLDAAGLQEGDVTTLNYDYEDAMDHLLNKDIDAMFVTAGAPADIIEEHQDEIRLLSLDEDMVNHILALAPGLEAVTIPSDTYGSQGAIQTVGVRSVLVASNEASSDLIYLMTDTLFAKTEELQSSVSADLQLDPAEAVKGITIPFHEGALKWYEEHDIDTEVAG
ncbi:MAG: TAXI family TRAP transporter solute-binding subunit [Lactimicrobium massiliense]|nr:TAXI family TRAP transporter solute-binding subunit [Lactimicrobium massiliense]MDD6230588.1 TAXI family TRAP transporter solute-binding subunit [Lactimicrobium massiliense]